MKTATITGCLAGQVARQLHYHRERIQWMEQKIEENERALKAYLVTTGKDAEILPGGYAVAITEDERLALQQPTTGTKYEQLELITELAT